MTEFDSSSDEESCAGESLVEEESDLGNLQITREVDFLKAGFHIGWFPYDRRRSRIADRRSQKVLRSSAIIWKHTSAIVCVPAIVIADDRRRLQKIEPCSIFCDRLRSFAIDCNCAIIWKPKFCDQQSKGIP